MPDLPCQHIYARLFIEVRVCLYCHMFLAFVRGSRASRRLVALSRFCAAYTLVRLIGAVLMACTGAWAVQTQCMQVEAMAERLAPTIDADAPQIIAEAA
ncbi:MAG: hypothetical protein ACJ8AW_12355 [Rhodopila sp.]